MTLRRSVTIAALAAATAATGMTASAASAEISYSAQYWEQLGRFASVEATWAPIRGVYATDPECALRQLHGEPIGCGGLIVIMNPDGSFGSGWIPDPSAPGGWRALGWNDCPSWNDVDDPSWWLCYG
jgi:hypothetical protein